MSDDIETAGRTAALESRLRELELLQRADQVRLEQGSPAPDHEVIILQRMAARERIIGQTRAALEGVEVEGQPRDLFIQLRVSEAERARIHDRAAAARQTVSQYIRARCADDPE